MKRLALLPPLKRLDSLKFGLIAALVLLVAFPGASWAQRSAASINGTVRDTTGAVIPQATLSLTNTETNVTQTTLTNATGEYIILGILPGTYTMKASKEGFQSINQPAFTLEVNQTTSFDFTLQVGSTTQTVTVEAAAAGIETSTAELGSVVTQRMVDDLPLNGRNFTQLLELTPGVSPISVAQNSGGWTAQPVGTFSFPSVNGQQNRSNFFMLDGINDQGSFESTYAIAPIVDGMEEFKVQSHNDEAQFGGALGGIINVVTKSGTNAFHGSAWEFLRNDSLDARNFFLQEVTPYKQNQFGGTVGGPVILPRYNGRNRTFFFAAYEGYRNHTSSEGLYRVPTAAELGGDLSDLGTTIYNPFSTRPDPNNAGHFLRDPFSNSQIPSNLIDPNMLLFAKTLYPAPVSTGVAGFNGRDTTSGIIRQDEASLRFDEQLTSKDTAFARYTGLNQPTSGSGGYTGLVSQLLFHGYNAAVSWVHTFAGSAVMQLAFGRNSVQYNSVTNYKTAPAGFNEQVGFAPNFVRGFTGGLSFIPTISLSGFLGGGEGASKYQTSNIYEFKGDFSKSSGRHTLRMGADFNSNNYNALTSGLDVGFSSFQTSNLETSAGGSPLASFLLGVPDNAGRFDSWATEHGGWVDGFYFQDQWKATDKFTINIGMRYDVTLIPVYGSDADKNNQVGSLDLNTGTFILQRSSPACSATQGAPCIPGGALPAHVVISPNGKVYHNTYDNWQPRIGLAYRLFPKTVVRLSYGRFFDNWAAITQTAQNYTGNWPSVGHPLANNLNSTVPTRTALDPLNLASGPVYPAPTPFGVVQWYGDPFNKNPYSDQWNLGVQHQLGANTVLSATYVGSHSSRLDLGVIGNTAPTPGPGNPQDRAPFPYITPTYYDRTVGRSNYNAFQFSLDRKTSHGVTYLVAYTWSKSIDIGCSGWYGAEGCSVQDPYHVDRDRSVSGFDLTQVLSVSWVYQLPFGKGMKFKTGNRALDNIVGNWQLNGMMFLSSGQPYGVGISGDIANTGNSGYERLNLVGDPNVPNRTPAQWLNKAAFAVPAEYTFGDLGRNVFRADWGRNFDISIFRQFPLTESKRLEFRCEAFNGFNTPRFGIPDGSFSDPSFGVVSSTANRARQIQFALKLYF